MTYTLTHAQANGLLECLDTAVKSIGLPGVYTITGLAHLLQNPLAEDAETYSYDITDEQKQGLQQAMDITVKTIGLKAATNILAIENALSNPSIAEEVVAEAAE